jgi:hypothetical protein
LIRSLLAGLAFFGAAGATRAQGTISSGTKSLQFVGWTWT